MSGLLQELKQVIDKAAEDARRVKEQDEIIKSNFAQIQYLSAQLYEISNQHNMYMHCRICVKETKMRIAYSCDHMYQCVSCDKKQENCPVCKAPIVLRLNVILPWRRSFFIFEITTAIVYNVCQNSRIIG